MAGALRRRRPTGRKLALSDLTTTQSSCGDSSIGTITRVKPGSPSVRTAASSVSASRVCRRNQARLISAPSSQMWVQKAPTSPLGSVARNDHQWPARRHGRMQQHWTTVSHHQAVEPLQDFLNATIVVSARCASETVRSLSDASTSSPARALRGVTADIALFRRRAVTGA